MSDAISPIMSKAGDVFHSERTVEKRTNFTCLVVGGSSQKHAFLDAYINAVHQDEELEEHTQNRSVVKVWNNNKEDNQKQTKFLTLVDFTMPEEEEFEQMNKVV